MGNVGPLFQLIIQFLPLDAAPDPQTVYGRRGSTSYGPWFSPFLFATPGEKEWSGRMKAKTGYNAIGFTPATWKFGLQNPYGQEVAENGTVNFFLRVLNWDSSTDSLSLFRICWYARVNVVHMLSTPWSLDAGYTGPDVRGTMLATCGTGDGFIPSTYANYPPSIWIPAGSVSCDYGQHTMWQAEIDIWAAHSQDGVTVPDYPGPNDPDKTPPHYHVIHDLVDGTTVSPPDQTVIFPGQAVTISTSPLRGRVMSTFLVDGVEYLPATTHTVFPVGGDVHVTSVAVADTFTFPWGTPLPTITASSGGGC